MTLDRSFHDSLDRLRREQHADRAWAGVRERIAAEAPVREAIRRAETLSRIRASAEVRNR